MGRLPFDPQRFQSLKTTSRKPDAPLTVTQAADRIAGVVRTNLAEPMRVVGEISGFRDRTHWYFDLKDADAVLSCAMWQSTARTVPFVPENGQEVVVTATADFYTKQGRLSLIVTRLEPVGDGALDIAFRALCEELRALGWFAPERKRKLPPFPRRIGVITSRSGAALHDVIDTMRRRCAATDIALIDARMQGASAAPEIAAAIRWAGAHHEQLELDALLITRGGGSMEDLWAFNERIVAEAILNCAIPVVAAIGHETDTTIAELVADARGATPTQAAMLLTPDSIALCEQIDSLADRLHARVERFLALERRRLDALAARPALADPRTGLRRARERLITVTGHLGATSHTHATRARARLERLSGRLEQHRPLALTARRAARLARLDERLASAWRSHLQRAQAAVGALDRELRAVGPITVLERGYSCTLDAHGRLVRSPTDVHAGERITTRLADGSIHSIVEGETSDSPRARRKPAPSDPEPPQMDLFGATP